MCTKRNEMTNKGLLLTDLPVELQEEIISFLPLCDRKSASLVCRSWSEIAFSYRLLRNVVLRLTNALDWQKSELNYLRKSCRRYRNLAADRGVIFGLVIKVLDQIGSNLEYYRSEKGHNEEQAWSVLIRAPNLQHFTVMMPLWTLSEDQFNFPEMKYLRKLELGNVQQMQSLNAPNLTELKLLIATESIPVLQLYANQLRRLELITTDGVIPVEGLALPKVEVLDVGECILPSEKDLIKFFTGLISLKELRIGTDIHESMIDTITKACPSIEKWHLRPKPFSSDLFCFLHRLKRLRMLDLTIETDLHQIALKGKPLASVQELHLDLLLSNEICEASIIRDLQQLMPNVMDITVSVPSENLLLYICQSFPRLKRLKLIAVNPKPLEALQHLVGLEELSMQFVKLSMEFMVPNRNLKRLKFRLSIGLTDENLPTLAELYPNLKYLELDCTTYKGIDVFRSVLVDCVVHRVKP